MKRFIVAAEDGQTAVPAAQMPESEPEPGNAVAVV